MKTTFAFPGGGDWEKWLKVLAALVALGVIPSKWGKGVTLLGLLLWLGKNR